LGDLLDDAFHAVGIRNYDLDVVIIAGGLLRIAESVDRLTKETRRLREHLEATSYAELLKEGD
jgi:hypothetical protein